MRGVWEITYACNMRCKHCGSRCGDPLPNELTTKEALALCDDLAELGLEHLTLSGGEPFLRPDWDLLAKRLTKQGVNVNVISNGWLLDSEMINKAKKARLGNICLSVDGAERTHDFLRKRGAYAKAVAAFKLLQKNNMPSACVTSVNKRNLLELSDLKQDLLRLGVERWQIQLAMPMGNLLDNPDLIIEPQDVEKVLNFCKEVVEEGKIGIHLGDNLGYFTSVCDAITGQDCRWGGCPAGKQVIGIRADGYVGGCLAIRGNEYFAGNVRERKLKDIWQDQKSFCWNRNLKRTDLQGFCRKCQYADTCLGGCTAQKVTFGGSIYAENPNCAYKLEILAKTNDLNEINTTADLIDRARQHLDNYNFQVAEFYLDKALGLDPDNLYIANFLAFVHFFLNNFETSLQYSEHVLAKDTQNAYALRGKGLCLHKLGGDKGKVITCLKQATKLAGAEEILDAYRDLVVVLTEQGKYTAALDVIKEARQKVPNFAVMSKKLKSWIRKRQGE